MSENEMVGTGERYAVPAPGEPQCQADGVRNGPDGPGGTEHYWSCTAPGTVDVDGTLMCEDHAGEQGYGPKQEEYGFDLADLKVIVGEDQPPGVIGMISHGRDFSSIAVCALGDPPVVKARTIRHPSLDFAAGPAERPEA